MADDNRVLASCPNCKKPMPVQVGRKSTCRTVRCADCGKWYDYSAWKLTVPPAGETVSLRTFYQVEFVEVSRA